MLSKWILFLCAALVVAGCSTNPLDREKRQARVLLTAAVVGLIEEADNPVEKAEGVCAMARLAGDATQDLEAVTIGNVAQLVLSALDVSQMSLTRRALAMELVFAITDELVDARDSGRLGDQINEVILIEWVADQVAQTAGLYLENGC